MEDIPKQLIRGVVELTRHKEFYGHVVQQFEKVYVEPPHQINTAAVGRMPGERFIKLYLNTAYFQSLYDANSRDKAWQYVLGALEHEILHVVLDHLFMHNDYPDKERLGVAMDCVVNPFLPAERVHPAWVMPEKFSLPNGKSVPWYYRELKGNAQYQQMVAGGMQGIASHALWGNVGDDDLAHEFVKDVIRKAKNMCVNGYGDIPGEIVQSIDDILKPKAAIIPWGRVLRMFCASATESILDYTMKRISKRFGTRPGTVKGDVLNLAVIIDTSGSISDYQLVIFLNEIHWIWKNGAKVTVFEADTKVCDKYEYKGKMRGEVHGRGGTNLEPAMAVVERKFDAAIYFTDFEAPRLSRTYRIPTLWVLTKEMEKQHWPAHWGRVIVLNVDRRQTA
jgi:predicted metal-dependent peptidase